ncbi:MAG: histidinol dehydrogenase [Firmicutes bacterium]|jgi:histidinol dehydrogenase|nr:histidinol dehydrogenase [Bacillota bacterium]
MINIVDMKKSKSFLSKLYERSQMDFDDVNTSVADIISKVRKEGDDALKFYTSKFDNVDLESIIVSDEEIDNAFNNIDENLLKDLKMAHENIKDYHMKQVRKDYLYKKDEDIILGQLIRPIEKVGIYVPGGSAAYPSSVLMNSVPAKIAGVKEVVMVTPPMADGSVKDSVLVAAKIAGVDKILKVGGAHSVAALSFGTESVPKVSKIVGPGNIYVSMAKKQVMGYVGIDMIAGPSEILIIADDSANPKYVAADLMSQAEHDTLAASILVTDSPRIAKEVEKELERQVKLMEREETIRKSFENFGAIIITESLMESIEIANKVAPEHLEIMTVNPFEAYKRIENAGAIFLGEYTPEPVGDYFSGTNHTLPTSSTAKFSSPLGVDDFIKKSSLVYYSKEALLSSGNSIMRIAEDEGLTAHSNSIRVRMGDE